jgi:hypothetical protein
MHTGTWHCRTAVSEGDENGVALGSSNLSTSNLSQWHHCESQDNQGRHSQHWPLKIPRKQNSRTFYLTLLLKRQEAPRQLVVCESWMMTWQNDVLDPRQHLGPVETLVIKEGNRVEERPKRLPRRFQWLLQSSRRTASKLSTQCCQLLSNHAATTTGKDLDTSTFNNSIMAVSSHHRRLEMPMNERALATIGWWTKEKNWEKGKE